MPVTGLRFMSGQEQSQLVLSSGRGVQWSCRLGSGECSLAVRSRAVSRADFGALQDLGDKARSPVLEKPRPGKKELRVRVGTRWSSGAKMLIPNRMWVSKRNADTLSLSKEVGVSVG